jgi:uncharacterized protein YebE (UPF0316 family)
MTAQRYVANGPVLSVTETLREMGFSKTKAAAFAREAERLVDEVLPPRRPKRTAKRPSALRRAKARVRTRSQISDAA